MDGDPTESSNNGDENKEILAPPDGPRENLINTAIKFLQNPKVVSSPLYQKKAFLEKKGLTQQEINIAIQSSGVKELPSSDQESLSPVYHHGPVGLTSHAPPGHYVPLPQKSGWARARDLTLSTVVIAGVSYGVYQIFQTYLRPLWFGKSFEERRFERLESQIQSIEKSVVDTMAELNRTLAGIQAALNKQQTQFQIGSGELKGISDLKADIASLKGLLLNKSQFPPVPSISPVLPSWQRAQVTSAPTIQSPSYADVVKTTSHNNDPSPEQTLESELTNSLSPIQETDSGQTTGFQVNGEVCLSDSQDLSGSKLTDSDSSFT